MPHGTDRAGLSISLDRKGRGLSPVVTRCSNSRASGRGAQEPWSPAWVGAAGRAILTTSEAPLQNEPTLRPAAQITRHPIHPMLIPVPIVCFIGALVTDIAYAVTAEMMWADFSSWLLAIGFIG